MNKGIEKHALVITLLLATGIMLFLSQQIVSEDVMPYTDAQHYVHRVFALYGFLHSGQWGPFWELFTRPRQCLAPLQYWMFFLLPKSWANLSAYGVVQLLSTYPLWAVAAWNLCRAIGRQEWSPALFLFCAAQNLSFDYPYFFFLDMSFCALGTLALSFQILAWREPGYFTSIPAGLVTGLLFWLKPANALLFVIIFILSEGLYACWRLFSGRSTPGGKLGLIPYTWLAVGFLPPFLLALACGAAQSILLLIFNNEIGTSWETTLQCTGFIRLFYFPLCLTYFYNTGVLAIVAAVVLAGVYLVRLEKKQAGPCPNLFPAPLLLCLGAAYLILGELFSFEFEAKTMRSMLMVLPVGWLFVFWLGERWRLGASTYLLIAVAYLSQLMDQVSYDWYESKPIAADNYQLSGDWLSQFPMAWSRYTSGPETIARLRDLIREKLPQGGKVGFGSWRVYLSDGSLSLVLNESRLLSGEPPLYQCGLLFDDQGRFGHSSFLHSNMIVLYTTPTEQYSGRIWKMSAALLDYLPNYWDKEHAPEIVPVIIENDDPLGYAIVFREPLTESQLDIAMQAVHAPGLMPEDPPEDYVHGRYFSWPEARHFLVQWMKKRLKI